MRNIIYSINKGINRPLEFRGLKAQYIWCLGGSLAGTLVLFSVLYIAGLNPYLCVVIGLSLGGSLFFFVYRLNNKWGQHGLMQRAAQRKVPKQIISKSRRCFMQK